MAPHCTSNQGVRDYHVLHRLKDLYPSSGIWRTSGRFRESEDRNTVYTSHFSHLIWKALCPPALEGIGKTCILGDLCSPRKLLAQYTKFGLKCGFCHGSGKMWGAVVKWSFWKAGNGYIRTCSSAPQNTQKTRFCAKQKASIACFAWVRVWRMPEQKSAQRHSLVWRETVF